MIRWRATALRVTLGVALLAFAILAAPAILTAPLPSPATAYPAVEEAIVRTSLPPPLKVTRRRPIDASAMPLWRLTLPDIDVHTPPLSLVADDERMYLVTAGGSVVAVSQATRRVLWRRTSDQLKVTPRHVFLAQRGSIVLLSGAGDAPIRIDGPTGDVVTLRDAPRDSYLQSGCPMDDGMTLLTATDTGSSLLFIDSAGTIRRRAALPWPGLQRAHPLQRQLAAASDLATGTCVLALMAGHGFAIVQAAGRVATFTYPDNVAIDAVRIRRSHLGNGSTTTEARLLGDGAPVSDISVGGGVLYVLFSGPASADGSILDLFSVPDGRYLHTRRFPYPVRRIAVTKHLLLIAMYDHGMPIIAAFPLPERDQFISVQDRS